MTDNNILKQVASGVSLESEDISKWEMETEPLLDKVFNNLIGYSENENGRWVRDHSRLRLMNENGASAFVQELRMRFNPNMQFSELDDKMIREIAADVGRNFSSDLQDNYEVWEVSYSQSNLQSICDQLVHSVYIFLRIAKDGGMKLHRERRGVKTFFNPASAGGVY